MSRAMQVARASWGETPPDWIVRLAEECDATSQNRAAARLGKSGGLVSQVLRNRYPSPLGSIEELVRGVLMREVVRCPELGELQKHKCQGWRKKARVFNGANALTVRMFRACHRCPIFLEGKNG